MNETPANRFFISYIHVEWNEAKFLLGWFYLLPLYTTPVSVFKSYHSTDRASSYWPVALGNWLCDEPQHTGITTPFQPLFFSLNYPPTALGQPKLMRMVYQPFLPSQLIFMEKICFFFPFWSGFYRNYSNLRRYHIPRYMCVHVYRF